MTKRNAAHVIRVTNDVCGQEEASHAHSALLALARAMAIRQARIDAMITSAANDNRPS